MLAENLVDSYKSELQCPARHQLNSPGKADMNDIDEPLDLNAGNQNVVAFSLIKIALSIKVLLTLAYETSPGIIADADEDFDVHSEEESVSIFLLIKEFLFIFTFVIYMF